MKSSEFCQPFVASEMQDSRDGAIPMINATRSSGEMTDLATRARAEFREMPGMCLTTAQAARLWQLSPARAEELLSELVQAGFLVRRDGQRYRLPSAV
jgi:DNA-binding IclR family transcriptional regulator